jgi:excisionase family DNA binding protein
MAPQLYTPEVAAEALECTASWLKEQARLRRIPFTMVGGQYRFSDAHLEEIIRIFEKRPVAPHSPSPPMRKAKPPGQAILRGRRPPERYAPDGGAHQPQR